MATILSGKKSTYGSPYAYYTVAASPYSRTPTTVNLSVTAYGALANSASYLGTGSGYGLVAGLYVGGAWHTWTMKSESVKWSGTTSNAASTAFTVYGLSAATTALTGISFRCLRTGSGTAATLVSTGCSNLAISSVAATYGNVALAKGSVSQAVATATLSGLPTAVGYARTIDWYNGNTKVGTTSIASSATASSYTYTYTGLQPNTDYTLKAVICSGSTQLSSKSVVVSTPQETGEISLVPQTTYISAAIEGMFNLPNYTRSIEFYFKKSSDTEYAPATTVYGQGTSVQVNITNLISNVKYDIRAIIKSGNIVLRTLTKTVKTLQDISLVPTAHIENITQELGTRICTMTWIADKSVAGTTYDIQAKAAGENEWTTLKSVTKITSPITVVSHVGNEDVAFRIISVNESVAASTINYSGEYLFYVRDDFLWDIEKVKGQPMIVTANEWNRLRDYALARNMSAGIMVDIPIVRQGEEFTAATYNTMKNAISNVSNVGVADKHRGDCITAYDLDALRVAVNAAVA